MDLSSSHASAYEHHPVATFVITLERATVLLVWLLLGMNFFFPWENFVMQGGEGSSGAFGTSHIILMGTYVLIAALAVSRPWGVLKTMMGAWPIFLLMCWLLMSVTWSSDPSASLDRAARFISLYVFSCYVVDRYTPQQFVQLFTCGFAITVAGSLLVMVANPALAHSNLDGGYESAWRGGFIHKNWLGAAMSLGVFVSGYSYYLRANSRVVSVGTFLGCAGLLVLSQSATGMGSTVGTIALLAVVAVIGSYRLPVLRGFALIGVAAAVLLLIVSPLIFSNADLSHVPELIGRSSTLTGRTGTWRAVIDAMAGRPLTGYGYGFWDHPSVTRSNIWLEVNWQAPHAHNTWLDALLQLGIVGLVLAVLAWLIPLWKSLWLIGARYGHGASFFFAILVSSLIRSSVETVMFSPALQALFWLVACYVYVNRIAQERTAAAPDVVPSGRRTAFPAYASAREQSA